MPTRSIKVKLIVSRRDGGQPLRRALWSTHEAVNAATRYYEERLLLMRGEAYRLGEEEITQSSVMDSLTELIKQAVLRNGGTPGDDNEDAVTLLRQLYEHIVPSSIEKDGTAQAAAAYIGPLTDPASQGFWGVYDKLARQKPNWVTLVDEDDGLAVFKLAVDDTEALAVAKAWLSTPNANEWMSDTGSPATWMRQARKGEAEWPESFVKKLNDLKTEGDQGVPPIIRRLRELRVLPLFPPYLTPRINGAVSTLSPWDRLALRLAVGHMLSWESWCIKTAKEHQARIDRVEKFRAENVDTAMATSLGALRTYEVEREAYLSTLGLGDAHFRVSPRQTRAWGDLKKKWQRDKTQSETSLTTIVAAEQTRLQGRFGDPDLYRWLAKPANHHLWTGDTDPLDIIATLNAMEGLVERSRVTASMTLPDPVLHPRFVQWEPPGGSNLRHYTPAVDATGNMTVKLMLLAPAKDDTFDENTYPVPISPSGQLRDVTLTSAGKTLRVDYSTDSHETFSGKLQSSDLLFDRSHFQNRDQARLEDGDVGSVYLKLVIDIDQKLPEGWTGKWPPAAAHFKSALGKKTKNEDLVKEGVRLLTIDLGVRTFASCSVFELTREAPAKALAFDVEISGRQYKAVHERSFRLPLPDEMPDSRGRKWRLEQDDELRAMRRVLTRYRNIMRLTEVDLSDRPDGLSSLKDALDDKFYSFEADVLTGLQAGVSTPAPVWAQTVRDGLLSYRKSFGPIVKKWRTANRRRDDNRHMGKSMWAIDYLTNCRRFLMSWSLLGRESGDVRRLDSDRRGTFAARLLDHINNIKEDRLKTGADLIVQASRGYVRDKDDNWEQRFEPCEIVLFEDLSRYRMRTDRPRRENSQLMKWAHRGVPAEVKMQGQLYGVHIEDTPAGFSSRFQARSNAPGIRCRVLTKVDFEDSFLRETLARDNINIDDYSAGDLIPWNGGEYFASVSRSGGVTRIHADINAAQNLQRRFWTRFSEPFRIPCSLVTEEENKIWVPRTLGKRIVGAMDGFGELIPTGHKSGSCRWNGITARRYRQIGGDSGENTESTDPEMQELEALAEAAIERSSEYETFFRDPSGNVLPKGLWFPSQHFWSVVKAKTASALK